VFLHVTAPCNGKWNRGSENRYGESPDPIGTLGYGNTPKGVTAAL